MAIVHDRYTVTTSATNVLVGIADRRSSTGVDKSVLIQNESVHPIYLGGPGVTTLDYGYKIPAAGEIALDLTTTDVLYVVAAEEAVINVLLLGV